MLTTDPDSKHSAMRNIPTLLNHASNLQHHLRSYDARRRHSPPLKSQSRTQKVPPVPSTPFSLGPPTNESLQRAGR